MTLPVLFDCPACDGKGCEECDNGEVRLETCPITFAGEEAFEMLMAADLLKKGLPPVAGGLLDQCACFIDAARFVWSEQAAWRAHYGAKADG